jgi:pimeloyl-ACP methyl ester carboxylesterase
MIRAVLLRLLALATATLGAVAAWVGAAYLLPHFWFLAGAALASFLLVGHLLLRVMDPGDGRESRRRRGTWLLVGAAAYMLLAHLLVGTAPERVLEEPAPSERVGFWPTPDGGELAYLHVPATGTGARAPVVFVHGGPGIPALPPFLESGVRPLDFLGRHGYPVYYYDQRGSGFSSRLELARGEEYSVDLHVSDLEAVREALGAERIIPVGHGWGATLAAHYLAAHPQRVERMILLSPAPAWYPAFPDMVDPAARARITEVQASALALLERPPIRLVIGRLTATTSPRAAHTLIPDWEADQWWTRATAEGWRLGQPNMTCSTDPARGLPPLSGLGFFAHSYTLADALRSPDPRPRLRTVDAPVLVLRGLCDHIRWDVAYQYLEILPDSRLVSLPAGGHLLWLEQQELMERVVTPFLAGEVVPLSYYHPSRAGNGGG